MTQTLLNRITAKVAATNASPVPVMSLGSIKNLGNGDLAIEFRFKTEGHYDERALAQKFGVDTQANYALVKASCYPITENGSGFRAILKANRVSKEYNEAALKDLTLIRANVFADPSDESIWTVVGDGENKRIVQSTREDQSQILREMYDPNTKYALAAISENEEPAHIGDYVAYYDKQDASMKFGFLANSNDDGTVDILDSETKKVIVDTPDVIMASAAFVDGLNHIDTGKKYNAIKAYSSNDAYSDYLAYLRMLYGTSNAEIEALEKLMKSSRVS